MFRDLKKTFGIVFCMGIAVVVIWYRYNESSRSAIADFFSPFLSDHDQLGFESKILEPFKKSKIELIETIDLMKEEIAKHEASYKQLTAFKNENRELRQLLGLNRRQDWRYVAAQITNFDPLSGGNRFRIDQGVGAGIGVGQPVLANGFLYGRILETSRSSSAVVTIFDPNCKVSVRIRDTNMFGILTGRDEDRWSVKPMCVIRYLPKDYQYTAGMIVETSALGETVPGGLPVGELAPNRDGVVEQMVDGLYKIAYLKSPDLKRKFEFVLVVSGKSRNPQ